jgi:hypothetical protein
MLWPRALNSISNEGQRQLELKVWEGATPEGGNGRDSFKLGYRRGFISHRDNPRLISFSESTTGDLRDNFKCLGRLTTAHVT